MSHLAHLVSSAFNVREVSPLCTCSECNKARSRATSAADVYLVAQPVGLPEQEVPRIQAESWERSRNRRVSSPLSPIFSLFLEPLGKLYHKLQGLLAEDEQAQR